MARYRSCMTKRLQKSVAVLCTACMVFSFSSAAEADDCAPLVAKIVQQEGAEFVSRSPSGNTYFLKHRLASELSVDCGENSLGPMVNVDVENHPFPSGAVFLLIARLGVLLTGMQQPVLLKALYSCHQAALTDTRAEMAERELAHGVHIECHAFTRDGGDSAFTISADISK